MKWFLRIAFLVLVLDVLDVSPARPQAGTCAEDAALHTAASSNLALRVLRHQAPVYRYASRQTLLDRLDFDKSVDLVPFAGEIEGKRVEITYPGGGGWMERDDLLCKIFPLTDDKNTDGKNHTGLERKLFVKTEPEVAGNTAFVTAYPSANGTECHGVCKLLSRFDVLFIFAEHSGRYLLADKFKISQGYPLVGWVDARSGIEWNTAVGLRPGQESNPIEIFDSPSDKNNSETQIFLAGGKRWYRYDQRVPLLNSVTQGGRVYNRVAMPGIGIEAFEQNMAFAEVEHGRLDLLKNIDVFFLLDGTLSMKPFLEEAKRAAQDVVHGFERDPRFQESSFRFGFRVYRDYFMGKDAVGEGMSLDSETCNKAGERFLALNHSQFDSELNKVTNSNEVSSGDTYPEALFDGMRQALRDIRNCPAHIKVLFVVGDAGDNQLEVPPDIVDTMSNVFVNDLIVFFVQTPRRREVSNVSAYTAAYDRYDRQAHEILKAILPGRFRGSPVSPGDHFLPLKPSQVSEKVRELLAPRSSSYEINKFISDLRTGFSLEELLDRHLKEGDLPALYLKIIYDASCGDLGRQCQERVDHRVIEAYASPEDDWVKEVWMKSEDLDNWIAILNPLKDVTRGTLAEKRQRFATVLSEQLQTILGTPPIDDTGETIEKYLERMGGLPFRPDSPLLQYELSDILSMEACEINQLVEWVRDIRTLLVKVLGNPEFKPVFELKPYPPTLCPNISSKGRRIPDMIFGPSELLCEGCSYAHSFRGERRFWIPLEFLP